MYQPSAAAQQAAATVKRVMASELPATASTVYAIRVGDRFFSRFGRNGSVQTSWSLAGAFLTFDFGLPSITDKLAAKGKRWSLMVVTASPVGQAAAADAFANG